MVGTENIAISFKGRSGAFFCAFAITSLEVFPDAITFPSRIATCLPPYFFMSMVGIFCVAFFMTFIL